MSGPGILSYGTSGRKLTVVYLGCKTRDHLLIMCFEIANIVSPIRPQKEKALVKLAAAVHVPTRLQALRMYDALVLLYTFIFKAFLLLLCLPKMCRLNKLINHYLVLI